MFFPFIHKRRSADKLQANKKQMMGVKMLDYYYTVKEDLQLIILL
jgi:hypothetical protein